MDLKRPSGQTVSDILGKDMATIARELNESGVHNEIKLNGVELNVNEIIVKDRKRQADEGKVTEIVESIKEIGLLNPVSVNKTAEGYILVAGLHRLTAYKRLGYNRIQAVMVNMDGIHSELAEIDENLIRAELHYLDRAELLKRRQEIYEELHPESAADEKRKIGLKNQNPRGETVSSRETPHKINTFVSDTAKKTGLSERAVQQDLQLAKNLDEGAKKQIKKEKISKGDALKVAREKKENQRHAINDLKEGVLKTKKENQIPGAPPYEQIKNLMPGETTKAVIDDFYGKTLNTEGQEPASIDEFIEIFNATNRPKQIRITKDKSSLIISADEQTLKNIIGSLQVVFR
ncbi:MAG: ParB N-terminal domain-containing protein [Deltaproteobacteria bacterium]|jgi:ParB/RepB/Spo0J family partition protein|nr:ParB N-terminal domain-containing protein [Deltaproteobacteria bacterium]